MQNRNGMTLTELIVVLGIILFLLGLIITMPTGISRNKAMRLVCRTNLKGIANALNFYASDYDDKYPVQGTVTHAWGTTTTGWNNPSRDWEKSEGTVTVASSLFLLVREADVGVKSFVCTASDQQSFVNDTNVDVIELWDFGPNPTRHQSYSYHFPYGKFPTSAALPAGNAIMADRSPWFDEKLTGSSIEKESADTFADKVSLIDFLLETDKWKYQIGNSEPHERQGQNVLFNDGHVDFAKRPDVGIQGDNIYTIGGTTQEEKRRGIAPTAEKIDAFDEEDSLLVNDRSQ